MDILIRNFVGIESADLLDVRIALFGGLNEAGKSSILQAAAAAIANAPIVRHAPTKREASKLVRRGADQARVRIREDGWEVMMTWPKCEYLVEGQAPIGHPIAVVPNVDRQFTHLDRKARLNVLSEILDITPSFEDLKKGLMTDAPVGLKEKTVQAVWKRLEEQHFDWDAAAKSIGTKGTKLKGQWEGVTGENYGSAKAQGWQPPGWTDDLADAAIETLERQVAEAREDVDRAIAEQAVDESRLQELQEKIDAGPAAEKELEDLGPRITKAEQTLAELVDERAALQEPITAGLPCPHCEKPIVIVRDANKAVTRLRKADPTMDEAKLKELRHQIAGLDGQISKLKGKIETANRKRADLEATKHAAGRAAQDLEKAKAREGSAEALEQARNRHAEATTRLNAAKAMQEASTIQKTIVINAHVTAALKPEGVRQMVLRKRLDQFNILLADLAEEAQEKPVSLEPDMEIYFGTEHFEALSDGAQRRVQIMLQLAFAQLTKSPLITIDRFEVVDAPARVRIFKALKHVGIPALVAMLAKSPDQLPNLTKAKYGQAYWVDREKGVEAA